MTEFVKVLKLSRPPHQPLRSESEDIVSDTTCSSEGDNGTCGKAQSGR